MSTAPLNGAVFGTWPMATKMPFTGSTDSALVLTFFTFRPLTARDLAAYVATGEWEGRAGGYAIQGRGAALVRAVEGDYLNVVGLPVAALLDRRPELLRRPA